MRILDQDSDKTCRDVLLYLTPSEALELRDSLNHLLEKPSSNHAHISEDDYKRELTVCIYDVNNLQGFNKRSLDIILNDN